MCNRFFESDYSFVLPIGPKYGTLNRVIRVCTVTFGGCLLKGQWGSIVLFGSFLFLIEQDKQRSATENFISNSLILYSNGVNFEEFPRSTILMINGHKNQIPFIILLAILYTYTKLAVSVVIL